MKKTFLLVILLLSISSIYSQTILFDNTKSEQAGNADWVIDNGSSIIPYPAQSGISGNPFPNPTGDVDTYWSGALSMFGIEMVKQGYTVETLPNSGSITYGDSGNSQDLSNYDVFVVCEPNDPFSSSEKAAMMNYVQNGGGLFMISDHAGADRNNNNWDALEVWNDFITNNPVENNAFGFTLDAGSNIGHTADNDYLTTSIANLPSDPLLHGTAGNVDAMETHGGATMTINYSDNSSIKPIVYYTGASNTGTTMVLAAYGSYGSGKFVVINDSSVPEDPTPNGGTTYDGWIQPKESDGAPANSDMDNGRLVTNATIWLATKVINPEPSNNVTNFTVTTTTDNTITLTWTDATGTQLPDGYLIKAAVNPSSITNPVDGTQENNSTLVQNIAYGFETITFTGLTHSTTYDFKIYPYTNSGANIDYLISSTPTAQGTTIAGADVLNSENFSNCGAATWHTFSVAGPTDYWTCASGYQDVNGYGDEADEDWLILSSPINFDNYTDEEFTFKTQESYDGPNLEIYYSSNYSGSGTPVGSTWNTIAYTAVESSSNGTFSDWADNTIDLSTLTGNLYIAFKYTATGSGGTSEHWRVDDILITGMTASCSYPTTQATSFSTSAIADNSMTVSWTDGDGDRVLVVAKAGSATTSDPIDGTSYSSNAYFGSGDAYDGGYVVYDGTGTEVNITNLDPTTTYYFAIYEYNSAGNCYLDTELTGSETTGGCALSSLPYTEGFESYTDGYLIADKSNIWDTWSHAPGTAEDAAISTTQVASGINSMHITGDDAIVLPLCQVTSGAYQINYKMYIASGESGYLGIAQPSIWSEKIYFNSNGIGNFYRGDTYFSYNQDQWISISILVDIDNNYSQMILDGKIIQTWLFNDGGSNTLSMLNFWANSSTYDYYIDDINITNAPACSNPTTSVSNLSINPATQNSLQVNLTRGDGDRILVLAKEGSSVDASPIATTVYDAKNVFGEGTEIGTGNYVVYDGDNNYFLLEGLSQNTTYHFAVFEYNQWNCYYSPAAIISGTTGTCTTTIETLPWTEDFETITADKPISLDCWTNFAEKENLNWGGRYYSTETNNFAQIAPYNHKYYSDATWLITPSINFDNYTSEILTFRTKTGYYVHDGLSIWISTDYDGKNPTNSTWTELTATFAATPTSGNYSDWVNSGNVDLSSYSGYGNIAFKYVGGDYSEQTTLFQVDDVKITGTSIPTPVATVSATAGCGTGTVRVSSDLSGTQTFELYNSDGTSLLASNTIDASYYDFASQSDGTYTGKVTKDTKISALSSQVTLTNDPTSVGGSVTGGSEICSGSTSGTLTLSGQTGSITKWQSSPDNSTWSDIANTATTYTSGALTATTYFRTVVTSGSCSSSNSSSTMVTISPATAITTQPTNQSACTGGNATFTVVADNATAYQWKKGGTNISGATSATLNLTTVSSADAATYTCEVTGTCGNVTSDAVTLTVVGSTSITTQPTSQTVCESTNVTFSVAATGSNLTYQWQFNGTDISGATSADYTITGVDTDDAGNYLCNVSSDCGNTTSDAAILTITPATAITTQPTNQSACTGGNATFTVVVDNATAYQWKKDGNDISGATSATLNLTTVSSSDAATYTCDVTGTCGNVTTDAVTLTVVGSTSITTQPTTQTVCESTNVTFSVVATGSNLTYQWQFNGTDISGATSADYTITGVDTDDAGSYLCNVSSNCGNATSDAATLTITPATTITTQPTNQSACTGGNATFTVVADNATAYQWEKDGSDISGATSATLSLTTVSSTDEATYTCEVTGTCGNVTTDAVTLTVVNSTSITTQPSTQTVCESTNVTISVVATGSNLTYQWQFNGTDISGATSADYTITGVDTDDAGSYLCNVASDCGNATSDAATLAINSNVAITSQPENINATVGDDISFTVVAEGDNLTYQWKFEGTDIMGADEATYQILSVEMSDAGTYSVTVSGTCGDISSNNAILSVVTSIEELSDLGISIYPNPSSGIFNIYYSQEFTNIIINIFDVTGKTIYSKTQNSSDNNTIDISSKSAGIYFIRFNYNDKSIVTPIIIE